MGPSSPSTLPTGSQGHQRPRNGERPAPRGRPAVRVSWGARNRTLNNSTRNCCVASYTTPHGAPECSNASSRSPIRSNVVDRASAIIAAAAGDRGPRRWTMPTRRVTAGRSGRTTAPWRLGVGGHRRRHERGAGAGHGERDERLAMARLDDHVRGRAAPGDHLVEQAAGRRARRRGQQRAAWPARPGVSVGPSIAVPGGLTATTS